MIIIIDYYNHIMRRVHIHMHIMHMGLGTTQKAAYTLYEYKLL